MSAKHNQSKKLAARNRSKEPVATWRNNYLKLRPADLPLTARCRPTSDKSQRPGELAWYVPDGTHDDGRTKWQFMGYDDEFLHRAGMSDTASLSSASKKRKADPAAPTAPAKKIETVVDSDDDDEKTVEFEEPLSARIDLVDSKVETVIRDISRLDESNVAFRTRMMDDMDKFKESMANHFSKLRTIVDRVNKENDTLRMDHTKALLRIAELEADLKAVRRLIPTPAPVKVSLTDIEPGSGFKPLSPEFADAMKRSRELLAEREAKIEREKKHRDYLTDFLERQHSKSNQEAVSPISVKKRTLDLTKDDEQDSVDLLEEAMAEVDESKSIIFIEKNDKDDPMTAKKS